MNNGPARRFNQEGLEMARARYAEIKGTTNTQFLSLEELYNDDFSEEIGLTQMTIYEGKSRAEFLSLVYKQLGPELAMNFEDAGMWTWIAAYHFNNILSQKKDGTVKGENRRVIFEPGWKWARHLIAGPMFLFIHEGPEWCPSPINKFPDWMEALTQRQDALLIDVARKVFGKLYCHSGKWSSKSGRNGAGSWREYPTLIRQLQVNYCLHSMTEEQLIKVLPEQYHRRLSS